MKISVITVTYNSASTLEATIHSLLCQTYKNVEFIVIDGLSTDGTLDIIHHYQNEIDIFISEKDDGIYDAMNKGISLATGDVISILNSDDMYANPNVLEVVANTFKYNHIDCLYGDLVYVDRRKANKILRYWKSQSFKDNLFYSGWHPPHPTFFVKNECYQKYSSFNLEFKIAADYELMLRFLQKYHLRSVYLPMVMVKMRSGGKSNKYLHNIVRANIECIKAWKVNNLPVPPLIFLRKPMSKLNQFFYTDGDHNLEQKC